MGTREKFIEAATGGRVFVLECTSCGTLHSSTVYFCRKCGCPRFSESAIDGRGRIVSYTIITVPPAGFEEYTPYAFVVMALDGVDLRVSGFMAGIAKPDQLPVGSQARIAGYDQRGLLVERT